MRLALPAAMMEILTMNIDQILNARILSFFIKRHKSGRPYSLVMQCDGHTNFRLRAFAVETSENKDPLNSYEINTISFDQEVSLSDYEKIIDIENNINHINNLFVKEGEKSYFVRLKFLSDDKTIIDVAGGDMPFTMCIELPLHSKKYGEYEFHLDCYENK